MTIVAHPDGSVESIETFERERSHGEIINNDGDVDSRDINPFVVLLTTGEQGRECETDALPGARRRTS